MYCPICKNVTLDVCPTQACTQWRQVIREKLSQGWTKAQIEEYFAVQYGDSVLAEPPARGVNWLVYLVPAVLLVAIFFVGVRILYDWRGVPTQSTLPAPKPDDAQNEYMGRMEEELHRRTGL
jgi:cytochrome c-type biogenesis protein CcmH